MYSRKSLNLSKNNIWNLSHKLTLSLLLQFRIIKLLQLGIAGKMELLLPSIPNQRILKRLQRLNPWRLQPRAHGLFYPAHKHRAEVLHQVHQAENTGALITFASAHSCSGSYMLAEDRHKDQKLLPLPRTLSARQGVPCRKKQAAVPTNSSRADSKLLPRKRGAEKNKKHQAFSKRTDFISNKV